MTATATYAESPRCSASARKAVLGQFFTPAPVADFMASLFTADRREWRLLDAGAGAGALTAAVVRRLCGAVARPRCLTVTAYEIDDGAIPQLRSTLEDCATACRNLGVRFECDLRQADFIAEASAVAVRDFFAPVLPRFNLAVVNPPYRKIHADSDERRQLRWAGIETSNLYAGFVALIVRLLEPGGQLVAITPRSFCNGPYFQPFRRDFLQAMSLRRLHVFESRSAAFREDDVLQENVIVHAVKDGRPPQYIVVSTSSGEPGAALNERQEAFAEIVRPDDPEQFIHLVENESQMHVRRAMHDLTATLPDLGLQVSTGRVVDFRVRDFLRQEPESGAGPLLYPCHFHGRFVEWPKSASRKPNALVEHELTRPLFVPAGVYVLVKRFSSKEERRRVVACLCDSQHVPAPQVAFENHLNFYHCAGAGVAAPLAHGLAAYLNSTMVDRYFRQFSGHTQVNAADLRKLPYPSAEILTELGRRVANIEFEQGVLDRVVAEVIFS